MVNILSFCYLSFFTYTGYDLANIPEDILYVILICIFSDIGGYVVGKNIGGKKLTKISPKKTISGSIGSFIFFIYCYAYFFKYLFWNNKY